MDKKRLLTVTASCAVAALPLVGCTGLAGAPASSSDIVGTLDDFVRAKPGVGVVAGVVDHGAVHVYTAGNLGPHKSKLDASTEFQIGSVTKTFTASLLAAMVLDGEVKLDDPIQRYLPSGVMAPEFHGRPITLRNLAEQNSGLPRLPTNLKPSDPNDPYADYTRDMLDTFLAQYGLPRAPGTQYEYSNLGVGLLGELLANRAHTTYAALLRRRVLKPLGMNATSVIPTAAMVARLAPGHDAQGSPAPVWHFGELGAAGALYSNLDDMLRYLRANLAAPNGPLGAAMAFAQRPRADGGFNGLMRIGLVWETNTHSGITWHNGEVGGYHAFIGFNREQQTGVIVMANVADMNVDTIALHILAPTAVPAPTPTPAAHDDPAIIIRVKALYASYVSGRVDTSQMTPDFAKLFTTAFVAQLKAGTEQLGAPTAWVFVASALEAGATRYDYRVIFSNGTRTFSVWIAPDGKIAGSKLGSGAP